MNPFSPSFGELPEALIGRDEVITKINNALDGNIGDPYRAVLLTGARGSGKTVLLERIVQDSLRYGYVAVNVTAGASMLSDLFEQLFERAQHLLPLSKKIRSISLKHFAIEFFNDDDTVGLRTRLERVISKLNEVGAGLLITIDEVYQSAPGLGELVIAYQHYKRERRNVALMLAGLPKNVSAILANTQQTKNYTFLRRAEKVVLKDIDTNEVARHYKKVFGKKPRKLNCTQAETMAQATKGYPFMVQLVGYYTWQQYSLGSGDDAVKEGVREARERLDHLVFESSLLDLSAKDVEFLKAMALDEGATETHALIARLGVTASYAQQYRKRLLATELIYAPSYGKLDFAIPYLREYLTTIN